MKKGVKVFIVILLITIIIAVITIVCNKDDTELKTVKSKQELLKIYEGDNSDLQRLLARIFCMPFSMFYHNYDVIGKADNAGSIGIDSASSTESSSYSSNTKDYSTTNIQVENVDPKQPKVVATIKSEDDDIPEDIILYKDKLVVISTKGNQTQRYYYNNRMNTVVKIYNITSREKPVLTKSYEMYEPYYTSRCIDNVLYVISSGNLRKEDDEIVVGYNEDNMEKEMSIDKIKYLKDVKTTKQTLISTVDLNNETADIKLDSYLMNISNAYVSENAIYLLNQKYNNDSKIPIKLLFGFKGVFGLEDYYEMDSESGYYTEIYKFDIKENVEYKAKTKVKGKTINQYSLDEKDNHLRIALYDNDGSRVAIFDEDLKQIGISDNVAKGEKMYSSRFIGDKVFTKLPVNVEEIKDEPKELPPFGLVLGVILIPLVLILISTISKYLPIPANVQNVLAFIGKPFLALTIATLAAMYFLGIKRGYTGEQLKKILDHSLRPVGMILLVIASGGVIRWMLQDSGLGEIIGPALEKSGMPLILVAFLIALLVRASVGSSMVAMTMASGIMATMPAVMATSVLYRAAMCCAICVGATALSHVNDAGFWLVGTFLEIDEKTTLKSWTVMETLIGVTALIVSLIISIFA